MKFNSQICTSREQSERLLALGLKKETADMRLIVNDFGDVLVARPLDYVYSSQPEHIPAWSLHRLIEMMPSMLTHKDKSYFLRIEIGDPMVGYFPARFVGTIPLEYFYGNETLYDDLIDCIEWLIKEGYFNKEYLCEK